MNFDEELSKQLKAIKKSEKEGFKIIEIDVIDQENRQVDLFEHEQPEFELDNMVVEYEKSANNPYVDGANKRHEATNIIKNDIIKPMFANHSLIKGKTTQQRANKINDVISEAFSNKDDDDQPYSQEDINSRIANFAKKYDLDLKILKESAHYFQDDKSERIYKWCLEFSK